MTSLYAFQFALPLILIGWLLPPWWAPFAFAGALGLAAWLRWRRGDRIKAP